MNLTVAEARERVAAAAGLCRADARVVKYLNRAVRRLLMKGKWEGTYTRLRLCVSNNTITWPRMVKTIEACAISNKPTKVRNDWYEFLEAGLGLLKETDGNGLQLLDRGEVVTFADITEGVPAYIRLYPDVTESGAFIILQGYDENSNWIRTLVDSTWIEGERVAIPEIAGAAAVTTKLFSKLTRVIKDTTNGVVRLYEFDGTSNIKPLAYYDPDERLPSYRRSFLPAVDQVNSNQHGCEQASVEVMAKLRYREVAAENDFLLIGNVDALEEETRALVHYDNKNFQEGAICEAMAVKLLNEELQHFQGDGAVVQLRVQEDSTFGAGMIENVV